MSGRPVGAFSPRAALALVVAGCVGFMALLWLIGANLGEGKSGLNNGGAHAAGKGLAGYAALASYLEKRGLQVQLMRSRKGDRQSGLLVLTPPAQASGKEIAKLVDEHRPYGPTLVIAPKWFTLQAPGTIKQAKKGWVTLEGQLPPGWQGFHDDLTVRLTTAKDPPGNPVWQGMGLNGHLPAYQTMLSGSGDLLVPLIEDMDPAHRVLAGYVGDGGDYPALREAALSEEPAHDEDADAEPPRYPLVLVFEPDLLNNLGFTQQSNAAGAERLIRAALDGESDQVIFDLTLNGLGYAPNLITLAMQPPYLAATLCLMLAALFTLWRAFNRFGPAAQVGRALAFGKLALVANAAALIRRTARLHLITGPYADAVRDRLVRALALPARLTPEAAEAAIDRALAGRGSQAARFSETSAVLRAARRPTDILRAAQTLHSLERTLTR